MHLTSACFAKAGSTSFDLSSHLTSARFAKAGTNSFDLSLHLTSVICLAQAELLGDITISTPCQHGGDGTEHACGFGRQADLS